MADVFARAMQFGTAQVQRAQLALMPRLIQGVGSRARVAEVIADRGIDTVLIVTTEGFMRRGVIEPLVNDMRNRGVVPLVFSDVKPDPDIECIVRATDKYRRNGCQAIVALGGGSVIDCAKMVGALAVNPKRDVRSLLGTMRVRRKTPFLVAIPTTAGTGSEATAAAVVTDPERKRKYAASDLSLIPNVAVLDPELLVGLPPDMTAYTGMDALTHAVEAYTNRFGSAAARRYAKQAVLLIFKHLEASFEDGSNLDHREQMLLASYYAGIAFTNAMVGYVHALAHGLGGRYHIQHGLANAVLLPIVMQEYGAAAEPRLAELAEIVGIDDGSPHERAQRFIACIREMNEHMGIPSTLSQIRAADISELAAGAEEEGNPAYPVPVIWERFMFEKVLLIAAGAFDQPIEPTASPLQTRITKPGPLLDEEGCLKTPGWATSPLLEYDRSRISASRLRIKEWDYYLVNDDDYAIALTIGDMGYTALVSASLIDFKQRTFVTESTLGVMPLGRLGMPATSAEGVTSFENKRVKMSFGVVDGKRLLTVKFANFKGEEALQAEIVLYDEPRDSMVIATPWAEDEHAFYYNQKIVAMRAIGSFTLGALCHKFNSTTSLGLLD